MATTSEVIEILKRVNPEHYGYGEPSVTTRQIEAEGLIAIQETKKDGRDYWYATVTRHGQRLIASREKSE